MINRKIKTGEEKDLLDKILDSKKLNNYEKLCIFYLTEIHIDNINKRIN